MEKIEVKGLNRLRLFFKIYWKSWVIFLVPIILLPIILQENSKIFRCLYLICVMAIFWITEVMPVQITALFPIIFFPLFDILDTEKASQAFMRSANVIFIGGIILAIAIEYSTLHKRLALIAVQKIGCSLKKLNLIMMSMTMFISMWISNTAAVAMMCPISGAILDELESEELIRIFHEPDTDHQDEPKKPTNITLSMYLGIAYAASIGGVGTIIGTGSNLVFKGIFENRFREAPYIDFLKWGLFSIPLMILACFLTFLWLQFLYLGYLRPKSKDAIEYRLPDDSVNIVKAAVETKLKEMGPISIHEISVMFLFLLAISLFSTRSPGIFIGWADYFTEKKIQDTAVVILITLFLFTLPTTWGVLDYFRPSKNMVRTVSSPSLVMWDTIHQKMPWGLILLLGGGFSLAEGAKESGFSSWLGTKLIVFETFSPFFLLIFIGFFCSLITNFTTNAAVTNIVLPVLSEMAVVIKIHPLVFMLPSAICCSFAFLLPIGSPPNAVVSSLVNIRTKSMLIAGTIPTIICVLLYTTTFSTYGYFIYKTDEFPEWAQNSTTFIYRS